MGPLKTSRRLGAEAHQAHTSEVLKSLQLPLALPFKNPLMQAVIIDTDRIYDKTVTELYNLLSFIHI